MNQQNLATDIWNIADTLRGDFKQSEFGRIILPFAVLRRLECVLEPTRAAVLAQFEAIKATSIDPDLLLPATAQASFYNTSLSCTFNKLLPSVMSATLPEVPRTVCTCPESASTPMWAFIPKCHWLPFWLECISGSRALSLFLVELGAAMSVASTAVPALSSQPRCASNSLTVYRI